MLRSRSAPKSMAWYRLVDGRTLVVESAQVDGHRVPIAGQIEGDRRLIERAEIEQMLTRHDSDA